jgi:hypothetical protein
VPSSSWGAPAVHPSQQDGLFSEQSLHALEIACQTSGFKFLVQPRIRERQMTMTTANDIQDITPAANWRAPAIWVHDSSADILRPAQPVARFQGLDLIPPSIGSLRKTMQEDNRRPLTSLGIVELDFSVSDKLPIISSLSARICWRFP